MTSLSSREFLHTHALGADVWFHIPIFRFGKGLCAVDPRVLAVTRLKFSPKKDEDQSTCSLLSPKQDMDLVRLISCRERVRYAAGESQLVVVDAFLLG